MNKKYKKGMEDASKAYEAFGKKQEDALNFILEEVRTGRKSLEDALKEIDVKTEDLYDHLQAKEKAKLYTVYTPFDIIELDIPARQLLLGILLKLTTDKDPNEQQQNYLRAVKKYLDIKDFPFGVDFHSVENIENLSELKAIYQVVLEYLQLQDGDSYDETALQQELLDSFDMGDKSRQAIAEQVQLLYRATGAVGLAEKYGYVPEEEEETAEPADTQADTATMGGQPCPDLADFEEITLTNDTIPFGETRSYQHKIIHIQGTIECEGTLQFDTCVIKYGEFASSGQIRAFSRGDIIFTQCTIQNNKNSDHSKTLMDLSENSIVLFSDSKLIDCQNLCWDAGKVTAENCTFIFSDWCKACAISCGNIQFTNCIVNGPASDMTQEAYERFMTDNQDLMRSIDSFITTACGTIENSAFHGITSIVDQQFSFSSSINIRFCEFEHCSNVFDGYVNIEECRFDSCVHVANLSAKSHVINCQFNHCFNQSILSTVDLINGYNGGVVVESCEFNGWKNHDLNRQTQDIIYLTTRKHGTFNRVEHCSFNGFNVGQQFIIGSTCNEPLNQMVSYISDCTFQNCSTKRNSGKLVSTTVTITRKRKSDLTFQVCDIQRCTGLDSPQATECEVLDFTLKTKSQSKIPLGADNLPERAGVPVYQA